MNDLALAEPLMLENLQLSYQLGNDRLTSYILYDLGRLMLATNRIEHAEEYLQKSINIVDKYGETHEMAMFYLYLGKCFVARADLQAAHDQFRQVIKIGHALDMFYLVYWGLVNIARTFLAGGQTGKALEIFLLLRHCPIEYKRIQEDFDFLQADLQVALLEGQMESAMKSAGDKDSLEKARADVITYVQENEIG
jgi:tetratricopeptide (TPR) repeat protein